MTATQNTEGQRTRPRTSGALWLLYLCDAGLLVAFGGDTAYRQQDLIEFLYPIRDTVLDKAQLRPDDTLLDVGAGDGLIAFGALERLGPLGHVIFSDISQDMLDHCRVTATAEGLLDRCSGAHGARLSDRRQGAARPGCPAPP